MPIVEYRKGEPFPGVIGRTADESSPAWPAQLRAREGAPNVLFVVMDDTGFGQLEPDLAISGGFPLRIPEDALAVPRHGVVNVHPALLPRYRGPNPIGWALRNGNDELGFTFHRMDADFDTGRVLAQGTAPLAGAERVEDVLGALFGVATSLLPRAIERVEADDLGDAQAEEDASYAGFFEPEYAEVDWTRSAEEVHRQVQAWWVAAARDGVRGPLADLGGERVLLLRTRLDAAEGGTRVECGDGPIWVLETVPAHARPRA